MLGLVRNCNCVDCSIPKVKNMRIKTMQIPNKIPLGLRIIIGFHMLLFTVFSCSEEHKTALDNRLYNCVFISNSTIKDLKELINEKKFKHTAFKALQMEADKHLDRVPVVPDKWYVPGYYNDAEGHRKAKNGLQDDANAAYALSLYYRITGQKKYARSAVRIINAWSTKIKAWSREDDSTLSFSYHFPSLVFAADLLRDENVWPENQQSVFSDFLRNNALPMNTMNSKNNWGNWGLVLSTSCAAYLGDEKLFQKCVDRWKYFIDNQLASDGHLPHEVKRGEGKSGIWYSHFCLMPQAIVAEILKNNGVDLYEYVSPQGRTFRQAFDCIAVWTEKPELFPYWKGDPKALGGVNYYSYFEILNARWPNDAATRLLKKSRPMSARHSAPFLTLTHGEYLK